MLKEKTAGSYEIIREGEDTVLRINYENIPKIPSVEDDSAAMSRIIDLLIENPDTTKIIFFQKREYEYDYAQTKLLGEIANKPHILTLRSSVIGLEIDSAYGLVEWFLSQKGKVKGYSRALYSGFYTGTLGEIMIKAMNENLSGLWQASTKGISKYDLLNIIKKEFELNIEIEKDDDFFSNKILVDQLCKHLKLPEIDYESMVRDMKNDFLNNKNF